MRLSRNSQLSGKRIRICVLLFTSLAWGVGVCGNHSVFESRNLRFDQSQGLQGGLHFDKDDELEPDKNDFQLVSSAYMSNDLGERWAMLTIENSSSGQRLLKAKNLVARFANGDQAYAINLDEVLKGKQRLTVAVFFGQHQFPIVDIELDRNQR